MNWRPPPYPLPVLVFQLPLLSHWAMASQSVAEAVPAASASGVAASAPTSVSWAARRVRARASDSSVLRSMTSRSHRAPPGTGRERAPQRVVDRFHAVSPPGTPDRVCRPRPAPACPVRTSRVGSPGTAGQAAGATAPGLFPAAFETADVERYGAQAGFQPGPRKGRSRHSEQSPGGSRRRSSPTQCVERRGCLRMSHRCDPDTGMSRASPSRPGDLRLCDTALCRECPPPWWPGDRCWGTMMR